MKQKKTILIVEDEQINTDILVYFLKDDYDLIEAKNGKEALGILKSGVEINGIILDLIMPVMDGIEFLKVYTDDEEINNIPLIVSTSNDDDKIESECLKYKAWDFIRKPYNKDIIMFRIKNAVDRSELNVLKEMKYKEEHDTLTGMYSRKKFYKETRQLLDDNPDKKYLFIRFDIHKFQLVNQFFGNKTGDELIKYTAEVLKDDLGIHIDKSTYGHIEADVFCYCIEYVTEKILEKHFAQIREKLNEFDIEYNILPVFGIYEINNISENMDSIYDKAKLASKMCKGNYIRNYEYYNDKINEELVKEQIIVNEMGKALDEQQFELYIQPKYETRHETLIGGEVLVRWNHPVRGMVSPGVFIPIFERNGFITKLDYYVWEHTCMLIQKWLKEGRNPYPVSVNISRVSLYNPKLVEIIIALVEKYNIPPRLLQLELTESAYTSNPIAIKEAMEKLQKYGFEILMDDFGSGYSSLNVLKDIAVDVLKIDMKFMTDSDTKGRGENILASVVRMAKWLGMPVIAEGVEKKQQAEFLRSVGCEYIQGYYYAKPMPVIDYEQRAFQSENTRCDKKEIFEDYGDKKFSSSGDEIWMEERQLDLIFSDLVQAVAIYEYDGDNIYLIRVNNAYYDMFGYENVDMNTPINIMYEGGQEKKVKKEFETVTKNHGVAEFQIKKCVQGKDVWIRVSLKYIRTLDKKSIVFGSMIDITKQKQIDQELNKYRNAILAAEKKNTTVLIVDDQEISRAMLSSLFSKQFTILEAENGSQAIDVVKEYGDNIDLILLDIQMPLMNGKEFLDIRKDDSVLCNIPVIIITSDNTSKMQIETIMMGAEDYIIKPFVPEVVIKRVNNVIASNKQFGAMLTENNK